MQTLPKTPATRQRAFPTLPELADRPVSRDVLDDIADIHIDACLDDGAGDAMRRTADLHGAGKLKPLLYPGGPSACEVLGICADLDSPE